MDSDPDTSSENVIRQFNNSVSHLFPDHDYSAQHLKPNHAACPLFVQADGRIILESFTSSTALDFIIAIAEPVTRPKRIHEYKLTDYSLLAAVSIGLSADEIIESMSTLSKTELPVLVVEYIKEHTKNYGRLGLVLKDNRYFIEGSQDVINQLLVDPVVGLAVGEDDDLPTNEDIRDLPAVANDLHKPTDSNSRNVNQPIDGILTVAERNEVREISTMDWNSIFDDDFDFDEPEVSLGSKNQIVGEPKISQIQIGDDPGLSQPESQIQQEPYPEPDLSLASFQIKKSNIESVKKQCAQLNLPLLQEYDFHQDPQTPNLTIDLRPKTKLRSYQEKALGKIFGNGRARSGIVALPWYVRINIAVPARHYSE